VFEKQLGKHDRIFAIEKKDVQLWYLKNFAREARAQEIELLGAGGARAHQSPEPEKARQTQQHRPWDMTLSHLHSFDRLLKHTCSSIPHLALRHTSAW